MSLDTESAKKMIIDTIYQNKGNDVVAFDVQNRTSIARYMIITSCNSSRHVKALAEFIEKNLELYDKINIEGMNEGNWVILSFKDIIVHIFRTDVREYYKIEELWN